MVKKAELNEKEIKDVNKRLYSKLIEKKDKKKNEDFDKKRELKTKKQRKVKGIFRETPKRYY